MSDQLEDKIRENAEGPAKVSGDAGSTEQHKLNDLIDVDHVIEASCTRGSVHGLEFVRQAKDKLVKVGVDRTKRDLAPTRRIAASPIPDISKATSAHDTQRPGC
jgi:hypothetical protein